MTGLDQRIVLAPTDGSLGPLLRIADDRLPAGAGYGRHEHRDVDVVAVVLAGALRHRWTSDADLSAGDVALLRAGSGLTHDEIAGADGVRVLQCYLRGTGPGAPPSHEVHRAAAGWVDLRRPDARRWLAWPRPGAEVDRAVGVVVGGGEQLGGADRHAPLSRPGQPSAQAGRPVSSCQTSTAPGPRTVRPSCCSTRTSSTPRTTSSPGGTTTSSPGRGHASHSRASGRPRSTHPAAARCTPGDGGAPGRLPRG
jgi:hypothetical protein